MLSARNLGLEVIKVSGHEEVVRCPFHEDTNPSAWWNTEKELFWCAVCNLGLNADQLGKRMGVDIDRGVLVEVPEDFDLVNEPDFWPTGILGMREYYQKRGVTSESLVLHYRLQWKDDFPKGCIMPIMDLKLNQVGAMVRYIEGPLRYQRFGRMTPVWPMHHLLNMVPEWPVIVTEGPWSAMRMFPLVGYTVFSLMGAKARKEALELLRPFKAVFLYDGDLAGQNACRKMRSLGAEHAYTVPVSPDDMTDDQIRELIGKVYKRCEF